MTGIDIQIFGQKYTIKGDSGEDQLRHLARYIENGIAEVSAIYPGITPNKALVLTLFNMAEEIHRLKTEQDNITKHIGEKTELLSAIFE